MLAESRDLDDLRARFGERARPCVRRAGRQGSRPKACVSSRPAPIPLQVPGEAGVPAYPALVDEGDAVSLRVFADRNEAEAAHPQGVRRLLQIALADKAKQARKQLPVSPKTGLLYAAIESQERLRGDLVDAALNALLAEGLGGIRDRGVSSGVATRPAGSCSAKRCNACSWPNPSWPASPRSSRSWNRR